MERLIRLSGPRNTPKKHYENKNTMDLKYELLERQPYLSDLASIRTHSNFQREF